MDNAIILGREPLLFICALAATAVCRQNIVALLLSIELMLLGVNLKLLSSSLLIDDIIGHIFVLYVLAVAAGETALGLSLVSSFYKIGGGAELSPIKGLERTDKRNRILKSYKKLKVRKTKDLVWPTMTY